MHILKIIIINFYENDIHTSLNNVLLVKIMKVDLFYQAIEQVYILMEIDGAIFIITKIKPSNEHLIEHDDHDLDLVNELL